MPEEITGNQTVKNRKKFLAGLGILSIFSMLKLFAFGKPPEKEKIACSPSKPNETMKFLSQDGQLMEVDITKIRSLQKKISDQELKEWVKKK